MELTRWDPELAISAAQLTEEENRAREVEEKETETQRGVQWRIFFFFWRNGGKKITIYPATPNTQQHHNMKSNPNTECLAKKIPIPSQNLTVAEFACYFQYFHLHVSQDNVILKL